MSAVAEGVALDRLAAIWCERWLQYGGSLVADLDEITVSIQMSNRGWRSPHADRRQAQWNNGWQVGRWRELSEICGLIPGLLDAIVDHVAANGVGDDSRRVMTSIN